MRKEDLIDRLRQRWILRTELGQKIVKQNYTTRYNIRYNIK